MAKRNINTTELAKFLAKEAFKEYFGYEYNIENLTRREEDYYNISLNKYINLIEEFESNN